MQLQEPGGYSPGDPPERGVQRNLQQNPTRDAIGHDQVNIFNFNDAAPVQRISYYAVSGTLIEDVNRKLERLENSVAKLDDILDMVNSARDLIRQLEEFNRAEQVPRGRAQSLRNVLRKLRAAYLRCASDDPGLRQQDVQGVVYRLGQFVDVLDRMVDRPQTAETLSGMAEVLGKVETWGYDAYVDMVPATAQAVKEIRDVVAIQFRDVPILQNNSRGGGVNTGQLRAEALLPESNPVKGRQ